jgi:thioesterase III
MDSDEKKRHRYPITILEHHLDTFGHVNNAVYLELFEEARWDYITKNGYGMDKIRQTGIGPVILEVNLKFKKELRLRQHFLIETEYQPLGNRLATILQEIKDEENQTYSTAEFKFGLFNIQTRKLVFPPEEWRVALGFQ